MIIFHKLPYHKININKLIIKMQGFSYFDVGVVGGQHRRQARHSPRRHRAGALAPWPPPALLHQGPSLGSCWGQATKSDC